MRNPQEKCPFSLSDLIANRPRKRSARSRRPAAIRGDKQPGCCSALHSDLHKTRAGVCAPMATSSDGRQRRWCRNSRVATCRNRTPISVCKVGDRGAFEFIQSCLRSYCNYWSPISPSTTVSSFLQICWMSSGDVREHRDLLACIENIEAGARSDIASSS